GFKSSDDVLELAPRRFIPSGTLAMSAVNASPLIADVLHPPGAPRLVFRTALSSASTAPAVARVVADVLAPASGASPRRVALLRRGDSAGIGFSARLYAELRYNGRSALDNGDDFRELVLDASDANGGDGGGHDGGGAGAARDAVVASLVAMRPHVV